MTAQPVAASPCTASALRCCKLQQDNWTGGWTLCSAEEASRYGITPLKQACHLASRLPGQTLLAVRQSWNWECACPAHHVGVHDNSLVHVGGGAEDAHDCSSLRTGAHASLQGTPAFLLDSSWQAAHMMRFSESCTGQPYRLFL